MTRSTLRCAAGILLAVSFILPGIAIAQEIPAGRWAEPTFLARLWSDLVQSLPDGWTAAIAFDEGDSGWQIDPDGQPTTGTNDDNGWQIDPNG
jgi:hypothetical protein